VPPTDPDADIILASPEEFYMWVILVKEGFMNVSELPGWVLATPEWAREWYYHLYKSYSTTHSQPDSIGLHLYNYPYYGYQYVQVL